MAALAKIVIFLFLVCLIESLYAASTDQNYESDDAKPEATKTSETPEKSSESGPGSILEIFKKFQSTISFEKIFAQFMNNQKKGESKD
ncbi:unnamed protein product, partial [Iphiclides podalirius]